MAASTTTTSDELFANVAKTTLFLNYHFAVNIDCLGDLELLAALGAVVWEDRLLHFSFSDGIEVDDLNFEVEFGGLVNGVDNSAFAVVEFLDGAFWESTGSEEVAEG